MDLLSRDIKLITLKKDFFFQSKNKWKPFKNEFLNKFIKENLNIESKKKFVISKNSGNEKNSNNYLIEIKNKKYILKSINAKK